METLKEKNIFRVKTSIVETYVLIKKQMNLFQKYFKLINSEIIINLENK